MSTKKKMPTHAKVKAIKVKEGEKQLLPIESEYETGIDNANALVKLGRVKILEKY